MRSGHKKCNEKYGVIQEKFLVDRYFCKSDKLQESMNNRFREGYFPKEIKLEPYQDEIEGFIIYELKDQVAVRINSLVDTN